MSFKCTLGLIACLNYNGTMIDEDDAFVITYLCNEIENLPSYSFLMNSGSNLGYMDADQLERLGLKFRWKPNNNVSQSQLGKFRKIEIKRACREYFAILDNPELWKNR